MTKTLGFILSACLAACAGQADVHYSGTVSTPELVEMDGDPSVMVVANSDEPVFYSENTYWLYRDHRWFQSHSHRGGWARIDAPPEHITRIQQPTAFVHYRRDAGAPRTTLNERARPAEPPRTQDRARPDPATPAQDVAPRHDAPLGPTHEPNSQGPSQPYGNPLPPHQVPPPPDATDGRDHPIAPDPDRAPASPGMRNRASDQRPAADRDDHRDRGPDRDKPLPPTDH